MKSRLRRTPTSLSLFSADYWRESVRELADVRQLCIAAAVIALAVVLKPFKIPISQSLQIGISFIASAIGGALLGPILSLFRGAASDIIGWLVFPQGAFNPAYTLSESLGAMIYALFLWRKKITLPRIIGVRTVINLCVNALLGSYWTFLYFNSKGSGYTVFLATSLTKNILMFPIEVVLMVALFNAILPPLHRLKLVPEQKNLRVGIVSWIIMGVLIAAVATLIIIVLASPEGAVAAFFESIYKSFRTVIRSWFGLS